MYEEMKSLYSDMESREREQKDELLRAIVSRNCQATRKPFDKLEYSPVFANSLDTWWRTLWDLYSGIYSGAFIPSIDISLHNSGKTADGLQIDADIQPLFYDLENI